MVEFTIERVRVEDLATTLDLFFQQVYPGDRAGARLHLSGHAEGQAETFLAWVDGRLAGYLPLRWESNNPLFRQRNIPLIHHLGVFPRFQRQGIASGLMDAAEQLIATRATQAGITVGLFDEYGPAQRLYAKRGYLPDGRGACQGQRPLKQGETITVDHDLILWLTKALTRLSSAPGGPERKGDGQPMAAYLITGEAGTGQSSVVAELQRRGYMACDGDRTPGLTYHADCRNDHKLAISDASIGSKRCFNAEN